MERLGPLGPAPRLACAVSGGSDSLALLLLLDQWCRDRGGAVLALAVDHGLRPEARDELAYLSGLCRSRNISFQTLDWTGPKPKGAMQVAARQARYDLLEGACRDAGILYLAVAHHQDDQAETFLLRLDGGSGVTGLSAMASWRSRQDVCYLRPLLTLPKERLQAYLHEQQVSWCEDPSNQDRRNKRVAWRQAVQPLSAVGLTGAQITDLTDLYGRLRGEMDRHLAQLLARSVDLRPQGYAWLALEQMLVAPEPLAQAALSRLVTCLSGSLYPPRQAAVKRLLSRWRHDETAEDLEAGQGATLGGCRLLPRRCGQLLVVRETAQIKEAKFLPGEKGLWDGRFAVNLEKLHWGAVGKNRAFSISCLGEDGWRQLVARSPGLRKGPIPQAAAVTLPAVRHLDSLLVVPHLEYRQEQNLFAGGSIRFSPRQVLADPAFT
ncbi:tRNA lysidine(34) synthetase TilS [Rhodovibrionaceae bacterium A322]